GLDPQADAALFSPDAAIVQPDALGARPDAVIAPPDARIATPDARIAPPDAPSAADAPVPVTLSIFQNEPERLAIDASNLYWTTADGFVRKVPIGGGRAREPSPGAS